MTDSRKASSCARSSRTPASPNSISRRRARLPGVSAAVSLLGDDGMVRFVGDPIAAVAAKDRKTAAAAIAAIRMTIERLPSVIGLDAARKSDSPVVFEKSSRRKAGNVSEGTPAPAAMERQRPRTVRGLLAEGKEGEELVRGRA